VRAIVTPSQAAMDVRASHDTLINIFDRIENFFQRLEIYTEVSPTPEMIDIIVKIMVEVLSILGIATKEVKQGRTSAPFFLDYYVSVD
jgi:hypothetical protein